MEGTIGFALAFVGLGGAGALFVLPHPYADYVGWSLIGVAILGLIALAIYHAVSRGWFELRGVAGMTVMVFAVACGLWYAASITPREPTYTRNDPTTAPTLISRSNKYIFACNVPRDQSVTDAERAEKRKQFDKDVRAWGQTIGFSIVLSDIEGGYRLIIKADTLEAQVRVLAAGGFPTITTVTYMDFRRVGQQIVVSVYSDLPKGLELLSFLPVNPTNPKIAETANIISKLLGVPEGTCHAI